MKIKIILCLNLIILIQKFGAECVTGANVKSKGECHGLSDDTFYCCYISEREMCYKQRKIINGVSTSTETTVNYDNMNYSIECPTPSTCETTTPETSIECHNFSKAGDSCCYYSYANVSGCYWYGSKFSGQTDQAGLLIQCEGRALSRVSDYFLFILILFYFNIL